MTAEHIKKLHLAADTIERVAMVNYGHTLDALELLNAAAVIRGLASKHTVVLLQKVA